MAKNFHHTGVSVTSEVKKFAAENNIDVIDTYQPLKDHVDSLSEPVDISQLPYFARDGYLNELGQEIVARVVLKYFE